MRVLIGSGRAGRIWTHLSLSQKVLNIRALLQRAPPVCLVYCRASDYYLTSGGGGGSFVNEDLSSILARLNGTPHPSWRDPCLACAMEFTAHDLSSRTRASSPDSAPAAESGPSTNRVTAPRPAAPTPKPAPTKTGMFVPE